MCIVYVASTYIQCGRRQQNVGGLGYVCGVQAVVVSHVRMVVVLQRHHVGHKRIGRDLKRLHQVPLLNTQ